MRTPEEIVNENNCAPWIPYNDVLRLVRETQQEAYEEGRRDGYAACKSDYATQITYNK